MTYAPGALSAARSYLIAQGVSANGVGIVGDTAHGTEGYHVGWDRLKLGYGTGDYSWGESPRDRVYSNAAMGLDLPSEGFPRLREFSLWLVAQCLSGAPDTQDIREVIYTPDGKTVKRWDRLGRRSSGDSSHLWHTHISYFRDSEGRDKTALFKRFFEGENTLAFLDDSGAAVMAWRMDAEQSGSEKVRGGPNKGEGMWIVQALKRLEAAVTNPAPTPVTVNVDAGQVASALAGNAEFVAAIVKAVNDDQSRRMAA